MFPVRSNKFFYKSTVCIFSYLLFGFFVAGVVFAQTIPRAVPTPQKINLPNGGAVSGSCPTFPSLANHISICGIAKTIDINVKDGVQYAQEPIKGATVAAYLGVKYSNLGSLSKDPNGTGELVGLIERLYTYDITNADGRFVLPVPKGAGTNGFIFLGFFCGDMLKDLYMIDTSQDLPYMPVSLACPPKVTPSQVNAIPAPPSINYADRTNFVSCEDSAPSGIVAGPGSFTEGEPGAVKEAPRTVNLPLQAAGLDNTRLNARVSQTMQYQCRLIIHPYTGSCSTNPIIDCHVYCCLNSSCCCRDTDSSCGASTYSYQLIDGSVKPVGDPVFHSDPIGGGQMLEVPKGSPILSRRDLEGFTHTSMGYSFQTISSLNCGISGCYNTEGPSGGHTTNQYLDQTMVEICNTRPFPPLNCTGPGIELAEPGEWSKSYELQKEVEVYPGIKIRDITQPQYSSIGQLIQEILKVLTDEFGFAFSTNDSSSVPNAIAAVQRLWDQFHAQQGPLNDLMNAGNNLQNVLKAIGDNITAIQTILTPGLTPLQRINKIVTFLLRLPRSAITVLTSGVSAIDNFARALSGTTRDVVETAVPGTIPLFQNWDSSLAELRGLISGYVSTWVTARGYLIHVPPNIRGAATVIVNYYTGTAIPGTLAIVRNTIDSLVTILQLVGEYVVRVARIIAALEDALGKLRELNLTTTKSNFFPYSTLLNYDINRNFREAYLNRPINDSYANFPPNTSVCKNTTEQARQSPSSLFPAEYPFNACYESTLLGEDTYSTQKALYLTTKNTSKNLKGEANDPVVSKFLAPGEPVGAEVSPKAGELNVTPVTDTPKVGGKGYWRLGVVQTMCSAGQMDYDSNGNIYGVFGSINYADYPVLGAYGEEGALRARPQY